MLLWVRSHTCFPPPCTLQSPIFLASVQPGEMRDQKNGKSLIWRLTYGTVHVIRLREADWWSRSTSDASPVSEETREVQRRGCLGAAWVPFRGVSASVPEPAQTFSGVLYTMPSVLRRCAGLCFQTVTCPAGDSFYSVPTCRRSTFLFALRRCYRGFWSWGSSRYHLGDGVLFGHGNDVYDGYMSIPSPVFQTGSKPTFSLVAAVSEAVTPNSLARDVNTRETVSRSGKATTSSTSAALVGVSKMASQVGR